jgi:hypothetical protein
MSRGGSGTYTGHWSRHKGREEQAQGSLRGTGTKGEEHMDD